MIAALLLAAAASVRSSYPVEEVLSAFGDVCFDQAAPRGNSGTSNATTWRRLAAQKDWTEVAVPSIPAPTAGYRDAVSARTYYWARALDDQLLSAMAPMGTGSMTEQVLFRKQIAGRDLYLSVVGIDASNPTLSECRLRDPLGDAVGKSSITPDAIARWLGRPIKRERGWYGSDEYTWRDQNGSRLSLRVHFGFAQRHLGVLDEPYDPYAAYGMTLVRSDYDEIIVT